MKIIFYTYFLVCLISFLNCQNTNDRTSIKALGLGGASILTTGTISSLENLSSLALLDSISAGSSIKNSFFIKELNTLSTGLTYSGTNNSYGLQYTRLGTRYYNENKIGIVYGKQLYQNLFFGARINYLLIDQIFYGKNYLFDFELGLRTRINTKVEFATHLFNPLKLSNKSTHGEQVNMNSGLRAGLSIKEQDFIINLEVESSNTQALLLKTGLNWTINSHLDLRSGVNFPSTKLSTGLGIKLNKAILDFYYSYHMILNHSSGIGICYDF